MASRTARRVIAYVHVTNPETAQSVVLAPGDEVPAWADKLVTNPKVFDQEPAATAGEPTAAQTKAAEKAAAKAVSEAEIAAAAADAASDDTTDADSDDSTDDGEPPTFEG